MALLSCSSSLEEDPRLAGQSWPRKSGLVGFTTQACPASLAASTRLVLGESASWDHHEGAQRSCKLWGVLKLLISRVTRLFQVEVVGGYMANAAWISLSLWLDSWLPDLHSIQWQENGIPDTLVFNLKYWTFQFFVLKITFILFSSIKFSHIPAQC